MERNKPPPLFLFPRCPSPPSPPPDKRITLQSPLARTPPPPRHQHLSFLRLLRRSHQAPILEIFALPPLTPSSSPHFPFLILILLLLPPPLFTSFLFFFPFLSFFFILLSSTSSSSPSLSAPASPVRVPPSPRRRGRSPHHPRSLRRRLPVPLGAFKGSVTFRFTSAASDWSFVIAI